MALPPYTQLDPGQVIKQAYDESKRSIRVDAQISAPDGTSVLIDATTDSIKIGNTATGPFLNVNSDGSINVSGSVSASNPSVGLTGSTAPTSATEIGAIDGNGKLQALLVDPSGKLLVDSSGSSTVTGTIDANINGLSTFQTSQYSIGTSSVQLTPTPLTNRSSMSIKAITTGTNIIYIGNSSSVTISTGYGLFNGDSLQLDLTAAQAIYAISNAANQIVHVLEIGD